MAEDIVLAANRKDKLLTVSLRPAGIMGEGDPQAVSKILSIANTSKTRFQLGSNDNLFDFTYVSNVAYSHLLAASSLLMTSRLPTVPLDNERVDGEVFIITNDQPVPFWDFARGLHRHAGDMTDPTKGQVWEISRSLGLIIGAIGEGVAGLFGKKPNITMQMVRFSCVTRYMSCEKAKRRLGYKPLVSLDEGVERAAMWWKEDQKAQQS